MMTLARTHNRNEPSLFAMRSFIIVAIVSLFYCQVVSGFAPSATRLATNNRVVVGAASTHADDIELTRRVIIEHIENTDINSGAVVDDDDGDDDASKVSKKVEKQKKNKKSPPPPQPAAVEIDISKLNILVGVINKAWEHETADKLYCEEIDVGEPDGPRQIASGLRAHYKVDDLVGRRVLILANLKSRKLMGFPSHGMVLCASTEDGSKVVFVDPPQDAAIGERVLVEGYDGEPATENQVIKKKMLDAIFPDLRTDSNGIASYKGVPLTAGTGQCIAEGELGNAQVS